MAAHVANGNKRKRLSDDMMEDGAHQAVVARQNRMFLDLPSLPGIYFSETVSHEKAATIFRPLADDILLNLHVYDQISFEVGHEVFLGDRSGAWESTSQANLIHFWRYSKTLFIAYTLAFAESALTEYERVRCSLLQT